MFRGTPNHFHGLTFDKAEDFERLRNNQQRVFFLMLDGEWHLPDEIQKVGGAKGLTRVRALREELYGGLTVEKERIGGGLWRYRLDLNGVTPELVEKYRLWNFAKPKGTKEDFVARCRKRLHTIVDGLSDEQVLRLVEFAKAQNWWKFGYHFYRWGKHGQG